MLSKIRALFQSQDVQQRRDLLTLPSLLEGVSVTDWLKLFIVEARGALGVASGTGLPLCGSIGFDAALLSDGSVVWHEYDIAGEDPDVWRIATRAERISAIILATKRMPQLSVLLPTRGTEDKDCTECGSSGYVLEGRILCPTCGGIGWVAVA